MCQISGLCELRKYGILCRQGSVRKKKKKNRTISKRCSGGARTPKNQLQTVITREIMFTCSFIKFSHYLPCIVLYVSTYYSRGDRFKSHLANSKN